MRVQALLLLVSSALLAGPAGAAPLELHFTAEPVPEPSPVGREGYRIALAPPPAGVLEDVPPQSFFLWDNAGWLTLLAPPAAELWLSCSSPTMVYPPAGEQALGADNLAVLLYDNGTIVADVRGQAPGGLCQPSGPFPVALAAARGDAWMQVAPGSHWLRLDTPFQASPPKETPDLETGGLDRMELHVGEGAPSRLVLDARAGRHAPPHFEEYAWSNGTEFDLHFGFASRADEVLVNITVEGDAAARLEVGDLGEDPFLVRDMAPGGRIHVQEWRSLDGPTQWDIALQGSGGAGRITIDLQPYHRGWSPNDPPPPATGTTPAAAPAPLAGLALALAALLARRR